MTANWWAVALGLRKLVGHQKIRGGVDGLWWAVEISGSNLVGCGGMWR